MQITKEYVEQQIETLVRQKDQLLANANAVEGAIQVYRQLKDYLNLPEEPAPHEGN